uniref:Phosphatidylinositol-glycan biosynthesis class X protein n=1 Tax=Strongyloides papillosus TaxID=174720 RepID=A0A0N5BQQ1_STREA
MFINVVLLAIFVLQCDSKISCKWLEKFTEKRTLLDVTGKGMYRTMKINYNITSMERYDDCSVVYKISLPKETYIDIDKIDIIQWKHKTGHYSNIEIENPAHLGEETTFYAYPVKTFKRSFLYFDKFEIYIKLRHFPPINNSKSPSPYITFSLPQIYMSCPNVIDIMEDINCLKYLHKLPCNSSSGDRCSFIEIPIARHTFVIYGLFGNKEFSVYVGVVTAITIIMGLLYILIVSLKKDTSYDRIDEN